MTKLSRKPIDSADFGHYVNNLWSAFTLMDSKDDIRLLFKDLFTHTEYKMFAKRLEIARRLMDQERYEDIQRDLHVTPNTINRVSNLLVERGEGLRKAHKKLQQIEAKRVERGKEYLKNLSDPFRKKLRRKTLLGQTIKAGAIILDRAISKKLKQATAKKVLQE